MSFLLQFFLFFFPLLAVHPLICAACHCQNRTTTMETNLYPARPSGLSYTHTQAYHMRPRASHALVVLQTSGWGGGVGLLLGFTGAIVNVAVNVILIRIRNQHLTKFFTDSDLGKKGFSTGTSKKKKIVKNAHIPCILFLCY